MKTMSATELGRNLSRILDLLVQQNEEIVIERHHRPIGRLVPAPAGRSALEVMGALYRTLPEAAAAGWERDARRASLREERLPARGRDPWRS